MAYAFSSYICACVCTVKATCLEIIATDAYSTLLILTAEYYLITFFIHFLRFIFFQKNWLGKMQLHGTYCQNYRTRRKKLYATVCMTPRLQLALASDSAGHPSHSVIHCLNFSLQSCTRVVSQNTHRDQESLLVQCFH